MGLAAFWAIFYKLDWSPWLVRYYEQGDQMFLGKNRPMTTKNRPKSLPTTFSQDLMQNHCLLVSTVCFVLTSNGIGHIL
jgi:hypothetical protein